MAVKVRERKDGTLYLDIYWKGDRESATLATKDPAVADQVKKEVEAMLTLGQYEFKKSKKPAGKTFGEYAEIWRRLIPKKNKESTVASYTGHLDNHILPKFKNKEIASITLLDLEEFLLGKLRSDDDPPGAKGKYSLSTVRHFRDCLSGVFQVAVKDEVIPSNPALNLRGVLPQKDENKKEVNPLSAGELHHLLEKVRKRYPEHYPMFLTMARTGIRYGEALALKWGDIDFFNKVIHIKRSLVRGKITTPKNKKTRKVNMSAALVEALRAHKAKEKEKGLRLGLGALPEFVFTNRAGLLLDKDNWRKRVFVPSLDSAEIRTIRIHDLRHTYATLRISKGDDIADVSYQLGHHSVKFTLDVYFHYIPSNENSEVDELDNLHTAAG